MKLIKNKIRQSRKFYLENRTLFLIKKSEKFNAVFGQILGTFWTCFPLYLYLGVKGENKKPQTLTHQGLRAVFSCFFDRNKKIDKTPLQELRFKCLIQIKNSGSGDYCVCLYLSKKLYR